MDMYRKISRNLPINQLVNEPRKNEEVESIKKRTPPPRTGKWESVKPKSVLRKNVNKKFKSYTNEFKVKILKKLDDVKEIYHIFQELVKTVKKRRKLSENDILRLVIQNEELPNAISTKFNKVQNFKLGDLETVINILEYRAINTDRKV